MDQDETSAGQNEAERPSNAKLTRGSITGHLVGQTLPAIIGVAAIMSIGLVDAYFIGQLGSDALATISFIFPISVALTSLGVGVMVGINSVVARALSAKAMMSARRGGPISASFLPWWPERSWVSLCSCSATRCSG